MRAWQRLPIETPQQKAARAKRDREWWDEAAREVQAGRAHLVWAGTPDFQTAELEVTSGDTIGTSPAELCKPKA